MSFLTSTRVVRTALASAALLMLGTVAAPAANAYNPDIDGDGIPNTWEMKGYDADGDGKIDVDFPGMGANPLKKDIFVEMDYMPGLLASEDELDRITESFAQLPVRNPNGTTGGSTFTWTPVAPAAPSTILAAATRWRTNSSTTP